MPRMSAFGGSTGSKRSGDRKAALRPIMDLLISARPRPLSDLTRKERRGHGWRLIRHALHRAAMQPLHRIEMRIERGSDAAHQEPRAFADCERGTIEFDH